jgi:methylase of polypeptide subunit release factors
MKRLMLCINAAQELTQEQERHYLERLRLRAHREPLQYILGTQCFYGCELRVDQTVLIPRQETEILCEQALLCMEKCRFPCVADVCTGSGAIAITLVGAIDDIRPGGLNPALKLAGQLAAAAIPVFAEVRVENMALGAPGLPWVPAYPEGPPVPWRSS